MDVPAGQSAQASAPPVHPTLREAVRSPRQRRPTGAPPPLPYHLQTSGVGWLVAAIVLVGLTLAVFGRGLCGPAVAVTVADDAVVRWLGGLRVPEALGLAYVSSWWVVATLYFPLLLALLVLRRWRHLIVWLVAWILAGNIAAGLAHRDVKPANLLVRDGRMLLIDVAFAEARPSPWRQAVDLANMMLCLALRSEPERVYQRALRQFTVEEITEAFARLTLPGGIHPPWFALGLALPSQLRNLLRAESRDPYPEFVKLLPSPPPPIPIQRWSLRRVGLWAAMVAVLVLATLNAKVVFNNRMAVRTPLYITNLDCSRVEPLWLMAQSVPSASLVPCVESRLSGWTVADVAVNDGRTVITLDHDRAGAGAVVVRMAAACDPAGAVETPAPEPGVRRSVRVERLAGEFSATWYDQFPGGCVTYRLHSTTDPTGQFANEAPQVLGFTTREQLRQALSRRSGGRLQLDPGQAR